MSIVVTGCATTPRGVHITIEPATSSLSGSMFDNEARIMVSERTAQHLAPENCAADQAALRGQFNPSARHESPRQAHSSG
jgi:hypothetical protein